MPMASNKLDNFKELVLKQKFVIVLLKGDALKRVNNAGMHMVHMIWGEARMPKELRLRWNRRKSHVLLRLS